MDFQIIYFSKTGKTKKVAEAIASELDIEAEEVKYTKLKDNAIIFLGSGCYGGKPAKNMINFIEENDFKSKNVALFGTSGSGEGVEIRILEEILNKKGAKIKGKFSCKGQFLLINRRRPNNEDLENAKKFANSIKN